MRKTRSILHSQQTALVVLALAIVPCVSAQQLSSAQTPRPIIHGSFKLPEISAAAITGNRLLVAADDPEKKHGYHMINCVAEPLSRLTAGNPIAATGDEQIYRVILRLLQGADAGEPGAALFKDVEDMAVSPTGDVYLITSHSRNKSNEEVPERQQLLRVRLDSGSTNPSSAVTSSVPIIPMLPAELQEATKRRPGAGDAEGTPGLNIEGLAWSPENDLLIGLRSPLIESKAVVLRLKNVDTMFDHPADPAGTSSVTIEATLDLHGMGIRGMCYDEKEKGYWIIGGLSPDPEEVGISPDNDWTLWFWDSNHQLRRRMEKNDLPQHMRLSNPEAVCVLPGNDADYVLLISDDSKSKPSSYVLVPRNQLK